MDIDLRYDKDGGMYFLNGFRVILLPEGGLETIQDTVGKVLGLATKSIFQEAMATVTYSFLTDLINSKLIKKRNENKMKEEIFALFQDMGFGVAEEVSSDLNTYTVTVDRGFNSRLPLIKSSSYCFQEIGHLQGIYRVIFSRDTNAQENKCKSTGSSDMDLFTVQVVGDKKTYNYIPPKTYEKETRSLEKIELIKTSSSTLVNSIPIEIIPATYFPYLFSKLRSIIGLGVYGIENNVGSEVSKIYAPFPFDLVSMKYQLSGFDILSPLAGVGKIETIKTDQNYLKEIDVKDSFNALHIDNASERRCFMLSGLFSGLSHKLIGTSVKLKETDCSAVNGSVCKFSFE